MTLVAVKRRECSTGGCGEPPVARGMCRKCYNRWHRHHGGHVGRDRPDPTNKVAYLSSLTTGELVAYCTGVLSRAAVIPGDPDEIARWMELVRAVGRRR